MIDVKTSFHNLYLIIHFYSCLTSVIRIEDFLLAFAHVIPSSGEMGMLLGMESQSVMIYVAPPFTG